jgi:hypothetical protein
MFSGARRVLLVLIDGWRGWGLGSGGSLGHTSCAAHLSTGHLAPISKAGLKLREHTGEKGNTQHYNKPTSPHNRFLQARQSGEEWEGEGEGEREGEGAWAFLLSRSAAQAGI